MLSVLIVNWNTRELLRSCLNSIHLFPPHEEYEVIVVDNQSSDGSAIMVAQEFPWVNLIESGSNVGYAKGNNLAFNVAKGDLLLTLNPDTEFEDFSLNIAINALREKENYGVLGLRLIGPDKKAQKSVRGFPTILGVIGTWFKLERVFPASLLGSYSLPRFDYGLDGPAPQPMGTFLLFRRTALETVGDPKKPFDEAFPIFFNEVDLLYRLDKAGWPCWYTSKAHVLHHHGASTKQVKKSMIWESHKSLHRYFSKHLKGMSRLSLPLIALASGIVAFIRAKGYDAGFRTEHNHLQLEHDR